MEHRSGSAASPRFQATVRGAAAASGKHRFYFVGHCLAEYAVAVDGEVVSRLWLAGVRGGTDPLVSEPAARSMASRSVWPGSVQRGRSGIKRMSSKAS